MKKIIFSIITMFCFCIMLIIGNSTIFAFANEAKNDEYKSKALFLIDYNTGKVLYKKNADSKMPVASITKLMTICLTCEQIDLGKLKMEELIVVSDKAAGMGGSQVFIEANAQYSVGDLLKSVIVSSANDSSVALAETIAGSEKNFVILMNNKAKELGLNNTNYVNCTGLPASNQFSSARDTAKLLKEVFKYDNYRKFSTIWIDSLKHPKLRESELVNTNKLIRYYEGCDGGKTGSTNEAGYCLAATAKRGNMRLLGVVLGAQSGKERFAETSKLLNFGFNNFDNKLIVDSSVELKQKAYIQNGNIDYVKIKPKENLYVLLNKLNKNENIQTKVKIFKNIKAPIKAGNKIGEIYVIENNKIIAQTDLLSTQNIAKANIYDNLTNAIKNWKIAN